MKNILDLDAFGGKFYETFKEKIKLNLEKLS